MKKGKTHHGKGNRTPSTAGFVEKEGFAGLQQKNGPAFREKGPPEVQGKNHALIKPRVPCRERRNCKDPGLKKEKKTPPRTPMKSGNGGKWVSTERAIVAFIVEHGGF